MQRDMSGTVESGRGLGVDRMTDPALLEQLQVLAGCPILPGTLNLRLHAALDRGDHWRYVAATDIAPDWEQLTGQAGYYLSPITIAQRYRGLAFQADEPAGSGYAADLIELFSEVHLRTALGLTDGDQLVVALRDS